MSLEAAVQQSGGRLYGDLHSAPNPARRLFNQDGYALEWIIPHSGSDRAFFEQVLRDAQDLLRAELLQSDRHLDALLVQCLGLQFRSRPDFVRQMIAIEQWVPALNCWMVNGYFPHGSPLYHIISTLEAGDPRKQTPSEYLDEQRQLSAKKREANDAASTDRVLGAIDSLTSRQVENFVAVEQALHTGERITAHGEDLNTIERLVSDTKKAAAEGDAESRSVLTRGQSDNPTCLLPTTNPLRHRHRSELTRSTKP